MGHGDKDLKDLENERLKQARESLEEAQALLAEEMDTGSVLTNLYYAYYYSILALMNEGQVPTTMQSVTLGLFEQQYLTTGIFEKEYGDAVRRIFDIKPKCSGEKTPVSTAEVMNLITRAERFIDVVEAHFGSRKR